MNKLEQKLHNLNYPNVMVALILLSLKLEVIGYETRGKLKNKYKNCDHLQSQRQLAFNNS